MKRSLGSGKLRLNKESLRVLSGTELTRVNGGTLVYGDRVEVESTTPGLLCEGLVKGDNGGSASQIAVAGCTGGSVVRSVVRAGGG
jgi:hypothetical protein